MPEIKLYEKANDHESLAFLYSELRYILQKLDINNFADAWEDLRFAAQAVNPPGLTDMPSWDTTNVGYLFHPTTPNTLQLVAQIPHAYVEGTDLSPHIHWEPTNTNTGKVLWRMEYRWRNNKETAGAWIPIDILDTAGGTAYTLQIAEFPTISKANAKISSLLDIKLYRIANDGSDTYNANALFKEFDIHYKGNSLGSQIEYVKKDG